MFDLIYPSNSNLQETAQEFPTFLAVVTSCITNVTHNVFQGVAFFV